MAASVKDTPYETPNPEPRGSSDHRMSSTTDVDLEKNGQLAAEDGNKADLANDSRPGAKAGLTVKQFWVVMLGYVHHESNCTFFFAS